MCKSRDMQVTTQSRSMTNPWILYVEYSVRQVELFVQCSDITWRTLDLGSSLSTTTLPSFFSYSHTSPLSSCPTTAIQVQYRKHCSIPSKCLSRVIGTSSLAALLRGSLQPVLEVGFATSEAKVGVLVLLAAYSPNQTYSSSLRWTWSRLPSPSQATKKISSVTAVASANNEKKTSSSSLYPL